MLRGPVFAIFLAIALGGAPVAGWIADRFGPCWALGIGVASGIAAADAANFANFFQRVAAEVMFIPGESLRLRTLND